MTRDCLKHVKGTITEAAPIGEQSWFRCGGVADVLFEPADEEDLVAALRDLPQDVPLTIIGGLANTIVRDGGVRGVTIRLGKPFSSLTIEETMITAGAGALNGSVASAAAKAGLGGVEFLSGIPGTLGGAAAMNAGAYGADMSSVLLAIEGVNRQGARVTLDPSALNMSYRTGNIPSGVIVTQLRLQGQKEDQAIVRARLKDIKQKRNATQPIREDTGGSTFANPSDEMRAWQVVDRVGGRGLQRGGAAMSEQHCNFMVNTGCATASDLESLGDDIIMKAEGLCGIKLRWEIKRIGDPAAQDNRYS